MPLVRPEVLDLGGGLNEGIAYNKIADNEQVLLENWFPFGRKLRRRGGTACLTPVQDADRYAEELTGLGMYKSTAGDFTLLLGAAASFAKRVGTAITAIPADPYAAVLDNSAWLWTMLQYKDTEYAFRKGTGMRRLLPNLWGEAGIAAAAAGPTLAAGAAGVPVAATYYGVVTGYNTRTGAESNPSPTGTVILGGSFKIEWSAIPVFANAQVNARRLYRTLPDNQGVYLFVAEIPDNITTTYSDNLDPRFLGDLASFDNNLPPPGLEAGDVWQERIFATDGIDLQYSRQFLPESWQGTIEVFKDDGHFLRAVHADGSRLMLGKTNKIHYLTTSGGTSFALDTLSDQHGCDSHHSMCSAENNLFWFGGDSFYRSIGGTQPESIASLKIKRLLERITPSRRRFVSSAIYPKYGWYVSLVALDGSVTNTHMLCYNYKADAWCVFKFNLADSGAAPDLMATLTDSNFDDVIYATFARRLYQFDSGLDDAGRLITAKFRTKGYHMAPGGLMSVIRRFFMQATVAAARFTARLYADGSSTTWDAGSGAVERSGLDLYTPPPGTIVTLGEVTGGEDWKGYNLSSKSARANWQLEIEYTGLPYLEISGLAFEAEVLTRRVKIQ